MNEVHTSTCYIYIQGSRVVTRQSSRPLTTNDNEAAAVASGPVAAGGSPDSGSGGGLNGGERERRLGQSANELAGTSGASFGRLKGCCGGKFSARFQNLISNPCVRQKIKMHDG